MTEALHIVCPHCHTTNRVKTADLVSAPDCGSCHKPLFTGAPLSLDEAGFDRHIARSQIPVLVDFWAPWCGPCRKQGPIVEDVAKRMSDRALVGKVNVDDEKDLATRYEIRAIPTLVILKGGRVIQRFEGVRSAEDLVQALEAAK